MRSVTVSNGFGQFHLRGLAEELERIDRLSLFMTGALPPRALNAKLLGSLASSGALRRLQERRVEIASSRVSQMVIPEVLHQISQILRRRGLFAAADTFEVQSFNGYVGRASKRLQRDPHQGGIYHVRAGIGGKSISAARQRGMKIVCDHSIAAPEVIDMYVPQSPPTKLFPKLWSRIQADIDESDCVLANSDFVAETFAEAGFPQHRVRVAYTPVDPRFADVVDACERPRGDRPVVTFAGTAEYRKGIDVVAKVIDELGPDLAEWRIIGDWSADAREWRDRLPTGVVLRGKMSRSDLAMNLAETDVFLFPSRAEGSARVAAEALRAGCQIVSTRMAGTAARHGVDGYLHPTVEDVPAIAGSVSSLLAPDAPSRTFQMVSTKKYAAERLSPARYLSDVLSAYDYSEGIV